MVALLQQRETRRQDGGHAGRSGHAGLGALQRGQALFEDPDRRVGEARVDIARLLA